MVQQVGSTLLPNFMAYFNRQGEAVKRQVRESGADIKYTNLRGQVLMRLLYLGINVPTDEEFETAIGDVLDSRVVKTQRQKKRQLTNGPYNFVLILKYLYGLLERQEKAESSSHTGNGSPSNGQCNTVTNEVSLLEFLARHSEMQRKALHDPAPLAKFLEAKRNVESPSLESLKNAWLDFVFPKGVPEAKHGLPQEEYEERLFVQICCLVPYLPKGQKIPIGMLVQGTGGREYSEALDRNRRLIPAVQKEILDKGLNRLSKRFSRTGKSITVSLLRGRAFLQKKLRELETLETPESVNPIRWVTIDNLDTREITAMRLSGIKPLAIAERLKSRMGQTNVYQHLKIGLEHLGVTNNEITATERKEELKIKEADHDNERRILLDLIYPEGIPDPPNGIPVERYEQELYLVACWLLENLKRGTDTRPIKLFTQGYRKCEIIEELEIRSSDVHKRIKGCSNQLRKNMGIIYSTPSKVDPYVWLSMHPRDRLMVELSMDGLTDEEIHDRPEVKYKSLGETSSHIRVAIRAARLEKAQLA